MRPVIIITQAIEPHAPYTTQNHVQKKKTRKQQVYKYALLVPVELLPTL